VFIYVVKIGALGVSLLTEYILDELADRNIKVRVFTTGSKMKYFEQSEFENVLKNNPDLIIFISPVAYFPNPRKVIDILRKKPLIVITNELTPEFEETLSEEGIGYIVVKADSMIGARREFLDPTEMTLYNSDLIKVLSITGVFRKIQFEIDKTIDSIEKGKLSLPKLVIDSEVAVNSAGFKNPYARSKAMAAYEIACLVSKISNRACFEEKDPKKYILLASTSHELMRIAARLADEAREIEKTNDSVLRTPHAKTGEILRKEKLLEELSKH